MTPSANRPKQNRPNRTIILGSARCVTPNTTEVQRANNIAALNCVRIIYDAFRPLASEWASTAAIRFSRPHETRYLVP